MICDICRNRNASVHVKKMVGSIQADHFLCPVCATRFGYARKIDRFYTDESVFSQNSTATQRCPCCGSTWADITDMGTAGCAECYQVFRKQLTEIIDKVHEKTTYKGRIPIVASPKMQREMRIEQARAQLAEAIAQENFEQAAVLRDYIRELENTP